MKCHKCGLDSPEDRSWCEFCGELFRKEKAASRLEQAAAFIEGLGWSILERGWKCAEGTVDFICRDHEVLVFVESRFDPSGSLGPSRFMLEGAAKAAALTMARKFLESSKVPSHKVRFDVIVQTETATRHHRDVLGKE